jgi:hypothetical protein
MGVGWLALALGTALVLPAVAEAGCGCDKPPPPRAAIRPFVASVDQPVTLIDDAYKENKDYQVLFEPLVGGPSQWSRGRVKVRRDLADAKNRPHLRAKLPDLPLGPCRVSVWLNGARVVQLGAEQLTVTSRPIPLTHATSSKRRAGYRAGVGMDGTLYIAVDVKDVSDATHFWGQGFGLPLDFRAANVAMYNDQGFLMQLLDPTVPGLFELAPAPGDDSSALLGYWRHEFRTYKATHRQDEAFLVDDEPDWHAGGTPHVSHDLIVIAIRGQLSTGGTLAPGASPPFTLAVLSQPEER